MHCFIAGKGLTNSCICKFIKQSEKEIKFEAYLDILSLFHNTFDISVKQEEKIEILFIIRNKNFFEIVLLSYVNMMAV